jgi:lysophospholipase L1-like esterase
VERGRPADARHVVVCAGDSITQGVGSANSVIHLYDRAAREVAALVHAFVEDPVADGAR